MWQMDAVTDGMPGFICARRWQTAQEQAALSELYARPNLDPDLYLTTILELSRVAGGDPAELLRLIPSPQVGHLGLLISGWYGLLISGWYGLPHLTLVSALRYLHGAHLPVLSFQVASDLLKQLEARADTCAKQRGSCRVLKQAGKTFCKVLQRALPSFASVVA